MVSAVGTLLKMRTICADRRVALELPVAIAAGRALRKHLVVWAEHTVIIQMCIRDRSKVNGHSYCIPTLLGTYSASGPTYRTDILEGTDWDGKMETMADYEQFLEYAKEAAPEMDPYYV